MIKEIGTLPNQHKPTITPEMTLYKTTHTCCICTGTFDREQFSAIKPFWICRSCLAFVQAFMEFFNWIDFQMAVNFIKVMRNGKTRISMSAVSYLGPNEVDIILKMNT